MAGDPAPTRRWAHQGGAWEGPSNTVSAMRRALGPDGRADALEFDVHRTRDGRVVVAHDRRLGRVSNRPGRLRSWIRFHTLDQLRGVDPAFWWVPGTVCDHRAPPSAYVARGRFRHDPDLRIPTVEEVLDAFPGVPMTIEIKASNATEPLLRLLRDRPHRHVTVTSFSDLIVARVARRDPSLDRAPGTLYLLWFRLLTSLGRPPRSSPFRRLQIPVRKWGVTFAEPRLVDAARRAGMAVDVWTVNDEATLRALVGAVDGIMTDRPSLLADVAGAAGPPAGAS